MGIRAMLYLIFAFLVLLLLSFIPSVRNLFASWFVSNQFKAIRFVLTTFGIIGLILGLLNWYMVKTPLALTEKTSFELLIKRELPFFEASKEKDIFIRQKMMCCLIHFINTFQEDGGR